MASEQIRTALLSFQQAIFRFHGPRKILLDSPSVKHALEAWRPEHGRNVYPVSTIHGVQVERWIFPFGELIVPLTDPAELTKHVKAEDIVRESDFPDHLAELKAALA